MNSQVKTDWLGVSDYYVAQILHPALKRDGFFQPMRSDVAQKSEGLDEVGFARSIRADQQVEVVQFNRLVGETLEIGDSYLGDCHNVSPAK